MHLYLYLPFLRVPSGSHSRTLPRHSISWHSHHLSKPPEPFFFSVNFNIFFLTCGPGSSVGIATDYGLDGPGSNPCEDEIFRLSRPALGAHKTYCKMGTGTFPGLKCGRGVLLTTHPLLVPRSWKSRAIPLPNLWAKPGL